MKTDRIRDGMRETRSKLQWLKKLFKCLHVLERLECYGMLTYSRALTFSSQRLKHISFQKNFKSYDLNKNS